MFVYTNIKPENIKFKTLLHLKNDSVIGFDLEDSNLFYNDNNQSGLLIFGYVLPRLEQNKSLSEPKILFELFKTKGISNTLQRIKGIFNIIFIENGNVTLINDHFGISKFFFYKNGGSFVFSDSIKNVINNAGINAIDEKSIAEYFLFNYLLNGRTFYKDVKHTTPSSWITVANGKISSGKYFDILKFLSLKSEIKNQKIIFENISQTLNNIIKQYSQVVASKLSLTLTAGLDSRILLGTLINNKEIDFNTFTFGNPESYDVKFAKIIANKVGAAHFHFYPENNFFNNFNEYADKTFNAGNTLVSIFRSHRLDAYSKVSEMSDGIIMGLAGSDLVRGIGFDGLIVSNIAYYCWNKKPLTKFFKDNQMINKFQEIIKIDFSHIYYDFNHYEFICNPLAYLFNVVVPLHFSQDVAINNSLGLKTFIPFLDIDYIDILKNTSYLSISKYQNYKIYDFLKRIRGLRFSSKLVMEINAKLAQLSIGKGYTPQDVAKNFHLIFFKNWKYKRKNKNMFMVANFDYDEWFWKYLNDYFKKEDFDFYINKEKILKNLSITSKKGGELEYLDFVKLINIHKSSKNLSKR